MFLDINSPKDASGAHKKRNRIQFISLGVWKQGFQAEKWFEKEDFKVLQDLFVVTREEAKQLGLIKEEPDEQDFTEDFQIVNTSHNPKSPLRGDDDASIYYQSDIEIVGSKDIQVAWYFGYEAQTTAIENALKKATNILAYTGIGGEIHQIGRTIEQHPTFTEKDFTISSEDPNYVNLSLVNPIDKEEFANFKYYSTTLRGGRMLGKNKDHFSDAVRMIKEGALITSDTVKGRLVCLGADEQERTLFRNGLAFLMPCGLITS